MKRFFLFLLLLTSIGCIELVELIEPEADNGFESSSTVVDSSGERASYAIEGEQAIVTHVIDGDTIDVEINGVRERIRYIGIDTPERDEPYYQEASNLNAQLVENETIILVKDVSETDRHGRLLRYIYLPDGTFVNEILMSEGYARAVTFPPDVAMADYFQELQNEARRAERGLWAVNELSNEPAPAGCNICERNAYNCRDFNSQNEAQACYAFCYDQVNYDVHKLDGGGDGLVCESLP